MIFVDNLFIDGIMELSIAGLLFVFLRSVKKRDGTSKYMIETWYGLIFFLSIGVITFVMAFVKTIKEFV